MISSDVRRRRARRARIEIIPLMDVMFLLLTFFIYVTVTMAVQRGIPVTLAAASSGEPAKEEPAATLSIRADGRLYFDKTPVTELDLQGRLQALAARPNRKPVVIQADKGVLYERVMALLDLARRCGVPDVVFAVQPEGAGR